MDASKIKNSLEIRARKPGDRIRPLGMKGTLKVADLFINHHIPQLVRDEWPLVVAGDNVLWVVGLHLSDDVRITQQTQEIVMLQLHAPEHNDPCCCKQCG
jgi:tRNA(Ile)-lysidine synthase